MEEPARKRFCPDFLSTGSGSSSCDGVNVNDDDDDDKESVYSWQSYETGIFAMHHCAKKINLMFLFNSLGS